MAGKRKFTEDGIPVTFKDRYDLDTYKTYGTCTLNDGQIFKFDKEDFNKIKSYLWRYSRGRIIAYGEGTQHKTIDLSHVILERERKFIQNKDKIIIFNNKDKLDYRKRNLIFATKSQAQQHMKKPKNNTSGVTGVCWAKREQKWRAYISIKDQGQKSLGFYDNYEKAVIARLTAEIELFGSFAPQMDLAIEKGIITNRKKDYLVGLIRSTTSVNKKRGLSEMKKIEKKEYKAKWSYQNGYIGKRETEIEEYLDRLDDVREVVGMYFERYRCNY